MTSSRDENVDKVRSDDASLPSVQDDTLGGNREQGNCGISTTETTVSGSTRESAEVRTRTSVSQSNAAVRNPTEFHGPIQRETGLAELLKNGQDANKLLAEVRDGLNDVKHVLVVTQQSMARGLNRTNYAGNGWQGMHTVLNTNGEDPHILGLPNIFDLQYKLALNQGADDSEIAQFLRFYGLGGGLIEGGDEPTIKEGKRDAARTKIRSYLGF
ncbi:hypothetical protein FRC08_003414 [Ceratobasidium sp. 394]|nr:hypothetical protein FRC08_003414 [Ceratobasidium sp. 394]